MSNDKMREALENSANFYFSERSLVLDTIDRRSVYSAAFSAGANWQAAITQQTESETVTSISGYECPAMIYLLDMGTDGVSWCEDPAPGDDMDEREAVKYIRSDVICRPPSSHVPEGWHNALLAAREYIASGAITVYTAKKLIDTFDSLLAALPSIAPQAAQVPEGWQLVPLEPTEHMKDCGYSAMPGVPEDGEETAVYKAMLTAAPSPEVQSCPR